MCCDKTKKNEEILFHEIRALYYLLKNLSFYEPEAFFPFLWSKKDQSTYITQQVTNIFASYFNSTGI